MGKSESTLGAEHPPTPSSMINLTSVLEKMGQLEKAESLEQLSRFRSQSWARIIELCRRVLSTRKSTLEKNHSDVLTGITNLTFTYHKGSFVKMR